MKEAIVTVTNDLTTDQRVDRMCTLLVQEGYSVTLAGRRLPGSLPLKTRSYKLTRFRLAFCKGPLFYAEYNISLFLFLLFRRADLIVSNDTDTLLAAYLAAKLKGIKHIHDCHEYFRGVPELVGRPRTASIWKWIEDTIFPRLRYVTAVNASIADLYQKEYGIPVKVLRNVPFRKNAMTPVMRAKYSIDPAVRIILYQGAVNIDRGLEEVILSMNYMKTRSVLVIIGTGDIDEKLNALVNEHHLGEKVILAGQVPMEELHGYTVDADLGLSIEKNIGINYYYCLPNKLMDYIQALVPVLVSPFPEMKRIVDTYNIGEYIRSHDPELLAEQLDHLFNDTSKLNLFKANLATAATDLCWEKEEHVIQEILNEIK